MFVCLVCPHVLSLTSLSVSSLMMLLWWFYLRNFMKKKSFTYYIFCEVLLNGCFEKKKSLKVRIPAALCILLIFFFFFFTLPLFIYHPKVTSVFEGKHISMILNSFQIWVQLVDRKGVWIQTLTFAQHHNDTCCVFRCVGIGCKHSVISWYAALKSHFYWHHNGTSSVSQNMASTTLKCTVSLCEHQCDGVKELVAHPKEHIVEGRSELPSERMQNCVRCKIFICFPYV